MPFLTLDTNVIVNAAARDEDCFQAHKQFNELRRKFLTPHVHEESIKISSRISAYTLLLKGKVSDDGMNPREAFEELKGDQPDWVSNRLERYLSNIVAYYQQAYENDMSLEQAEQKLQRTISTYHDMREKVRPSSTELEDSAEMIERYRDTIRDHDLVDAWDEDIIIQMQVYHDLRDKPLSLVTENLKDFNDDADEWDEHFSELSILSPQEWIAD